MPVAANHDLAPANSKRVLCSPTKTEMMWNEKEQGKYIFLNTLTKRENIL